MAAPLLFLVLDLSERFVGAMFHAQGPIFARALVAGLIDSPAHGPGLRVAKNLDAAPLRPETTRVVKGTDQLADLASVAEFRITRDSIHFSPHSKARQDIF
jgi:hypothetical protein